MPPDQVPDVLVVAQAQIEDIDHDRQGLEAVVAHVVHSRDGVEGLGRRAQTWSSKPASEIASAIGAPWSPNPTKPIFISDMVASPISGDQLEGEVPQTLRIAGINRVGCIAPRKVRWAPRDLLGLVAIFKVKTTDALKKRRGGEQY
jgi:hypothetical protein